MFLFLKELGDATQDASQLVHQLVQQLRRQQVDLQRARQVLATSKSKTLRNSKTFINIEIIRVAKTLFRYPSFKIKSKLIIVTLKEKTEKENQPNWRF